MVGDYRNCAHVPYFVCINECLRNKIYNEEPDMYRKECVTTINMQYISIASVNLWGRKRMCVFEQRY